MKLRWKRLFFYRWLMGKSRGQRILLSLFLSVLTILLAAFVGFLHLMVMLFTETTTQTLGGFFLLMPFTAYMLYATYATTIVLLRSLVVD